MALEPVLSFVDTAAFRRIGDIDCAIWTYSLSWSAAETWWSLASRETATGFAHVAIKFSHRLDIHPPTEFPEVPEIRATSLEKPAAGAAQNLVRTFGAEPQPPILFRFVAPATKDDFSAAQLVHKVTAEAA